MSHPEQMQFISDLKIKFPHFFVASKVLEVGSLDINGSVRTHFTNCNYLGLDVGAGPGVDVVCEGQNYNGESNFYDVVISCECFEHNPFWIETFKNMYRMCRSGGLVIITCATEGRPEHGTSLSDPKSSPLTIAKGWNYYKNLNQLDFESNLNIDDMFKDFEFSFNEKAHDIYFYGIKK